MIRRLLVVLAIAVGVGASAVAFASPASAHATLESTSPAADEVLQTLPTEVVLHFDAAVDASIGGVDVYGPDGVRLPAAALRRLDGGKAIHRPITVTARGTYTVSWRVVSEDGHTITGSFVFHYIEKRGSSTVIGESGSAASILGWFSRCLIFIGAMTCIGAMLLGLVSSMSDHPRLGALAWWGSCAALVGSLGALWSRAAQASGKSLWSSFSVVGELVSSNRSGALDASRIAVAMIAVVALLTIGRSRFVALPAMAVVLDTFSLSGHAWTASPVAVTVTVDTVHLLAAAAWAGGLIALACVVRTLDDPKPVMRRFSAIATVALLVVIATGSVSSLVHVDSWSSLLHTDYGNLLMIKVGVVAVMVALGVTHRRIVAKGFEIVGHRLATISLEALLGIVVIGITAGLIFTAPAVDTAPRKYSVTQTTPSGLIRLDVSLARVGANNLRLTFLGADGRLRAVDNVQVDVGTDSIAPRRLTTAIDDASHWTVSGASLAAPGKWMVTIVATHSEGFGDAANEVSETTRFEVMLK